MDRDPSEGEKKRRQFVVELTKLGDRGTGTEAIKRSARRLVSNSDLTGDLLDALDRHSLEEWYRRLSRKDHYLSSHCQ